MVLIVGIVKANMTSDFSNLWHNLVRHIPLVTLMPELNLFEVRQIFQAWPKKIMLGPSSIFSLGEIIVWSRETIFAQETQIARILVLVFFLLQVTQSCKGPEMQKPDSFCFTLIERCHSNLSFQVQLNKLERRAKIRWRAQRLWSQAKTRRLSEGNSKTTSSKRIIEKFPL